MESIGEIIDQQSLGESLVVETSVDSPNQSSHGTVVMVGTVIDGIVTGHHTQHHNHQQQQHHHQQQQLHLNSNNDRHHHDHQSQSSHHHHHHHHHVSNDDCISTESELSAAVALGPLSVSTTPGSHSRIITHTGQSLELIKQEHKVAGVDVVVASAGELSPEDVEVTLDAAAHHHHHHHHHHHSNRHETLSVIVQPQDDSRDSQLLSPGKLTPSSEMIDTSDFRSLHEPTYQTLTSVNGRMSPPGFSPNSSYATLTPLQPLPPISTMSDKFAYGHASNVSGSFTVMQNNNMSSLSLGLSGVNSPFNYDKLPSIGMSPPHNYSSPTNTLGGMGMSQQPSPLSPQSSYSQNELQSPQKSLSPAGYESPYGHRDLLNRQQLQQHSPTLSPQSTSLNSPGGNTLTGGSFGATTLATINGLTSIATHSNVVSPIPHSTPPGLVQISHVHREAVVVQSPSPPSLTIQHTPLQHHQVISGKTAFIIGANHQQRQQQNNNGSSGNSNGQQHNGQHRNGGLTTTQTIQQSIATGNNNNNSNTNNNNNNTSNNAAPVSITSLSSDAEEINTKELAQRISAELKRYSIPQAIFAQRVLCRSQGTLSDLLRNPKPWSKLKSGRETFRRMYKWLQEPEFQRMSALRMADNQISAVRNVNVNLVSNNNNNNIQCNYDNYNSSINNGEDDKMAPTTTTFPSSTDFSPFFTYFQSLSKSSHDCVRRLYISETIPSIHSPAAQIPQRGSCKRKEESQPTEHMPTPKKPRLVFTDLQRRTLQAIFKETKRPSKEMQVTIARQLGLEPTTVGNFFMNARRRSMDKWKDEDPKNSNQSALSPGNPHSLDLDDGDDMDLELGQDNDFDLDHDHDTDPEHDDML